MRLYLPTPFTRPHPNPFWGAALGVLSALLISAGCASTGVPSALNNPTPIAATTYPVAFEASVAVLRDAGFGVDRHDFRFGKVSSKPQGSPTVIEVWKADNTYADQAFRSTLGDLRRTVTVSFIPQTSPDQDNPNRGYDLGVEVLIERLQIPQRRMNGATQGAVFADLAEVPEELQARGITQPYWQPTGRDVHLEQRLLRDILERARS